MRFLELKVPPVAVGALVAAGAWGADRIDWMTWSHASWTTVLALVFAATGFVAAVAGVISFKRARTTVDPFNPDKASELVTTGIYAYTRNPMYLGMFLVIMGWAIRMDGLLPILVTLLFIPYMTRFQIAPEEWAMMSLFDGAFEEYRSRVRRWM